MIGDQFSKEHCKAQNCHFTVLKRLFLSNALCILSLHDFTHDCSSYLKKWRLLFNNINNQSVKFDKNITQALLQRNDLGFGAQYSLSMLHFHQFLTLMGGFPGEGVFPPNNFPLLMDVSSQFPTRRDTKIGYSH